MNLEARQPCTPVSRIAIRGFKSIRDASVDLGLLNVFVGPNGAGKSAFLEAIGVLGAALNGRVDDEALLRRGVRPGVPALYKSSFRKRRLPMQIDLSAKLGSASVKVLLRNPTRAGSSAWTYFSESLREGRTTLVGRSEANLERMDPDAGKIAASMADVDPDSDASRVVGSLRDFAIYAPNTPALRGLVPEPHRSPIGLYGGRLAEAMKEVQRETSSDELDDLLRFIPWARSIGVGSSDAGLVSRSVPTPQVVLEFTDRYMAEGRNRLTAYDASEGALFVVFSMVAALHPHMPPLFAVDNIDRGIHPVLARELMRQMADWILERRDRQMMLTAQNPAVLDGLPLQEDDVRLFVVSRLSDGATQIRRIELTPAHLRLAAQGHSLSRMWVSGELGGVPDV